MPTQEDYWRALQARICAKCLDGDGRGECRISPDRSCAMKMYFPQILEVVNSVYSHSIEPYEGELRTKVCFHCKNQTSDGRCSLREDVECSLDRYFPLIVEVIEETQMRERLVAASKWVS
jgi:hypothetical protein